MAKKQFYGIKYPFTTDDFENYYVDLNSEVKDKVKSILMHVVFTPKGQKIRDPEFGTNLIKFIFEPGDDMSFDGIKEEVSNAVRKYVNGITVNNISILKSEEDLSEIYVRLDYTVFDGINKIDDSLVTKL